MIWSRRRVKKSTNASTRNWAFAGRAKQGKAGQSKAKEYLSWNGHHGYSKKLERH